MTIIIKCYSCQGHNKHKHDVSDFKETEFNTFSDAHKHMIENPEHWMDFVVKEDNEE